MAISPWHVGQLAPNATITLTYDSGTVVDLTGYSSVSLLFVSQSDGTSFAGAGSGSAPTPSNGQIVYTWAAADVATEGRYVIRPSVLFSGKPLRCDDIPWVVLP